MQVNEVPEPWASAMLAKGFIHAMRPSIRALSRAAGIGSAETVRQMIYGTRVPDPETVERVASALGRSPVEVSQWVNQQRTTRRTYVVPPEVALLTEDEQDAVSGLILAIARSRRGQAVGLDVSDEEIEAARLAARAAKRKRAEMGLLTGPLAEIALDDGFLEGVPYDQLAARRGELQRTADDRALDTAGEESQVSPDDGE